MTGLSEGTFYIRWCFHRKERGDKHFDVALVTSALCLFAFFCLTFFFRLIVTLVTSTLFEFSLIVTSLSSALFVFWALIVTFISNQRAFCFMA